MKSRLALLFGLALASASLCAAEPEPVRVLFLGNSFTARNNLAGIVRALAAADQPAVKLETTVITYGGKTMEYHWGLFSQNWVKLPALTESELDRSLAELKAQSARSPNDGNVRRAIIRHEALRAALKSPKPKWDYVVLQSWKDTAGGMRSAYVESARRLATLARQHGAKVIFYDTAQDTLNAAPLTSPPPPRAPAEERARMLASLAAEFDGLAVPMPLVVWHCQSERPDLPLRYVKDFHPNQTTSYLTAVTIHLMISGHSAEGLAVNEVTDNKISDPAHPELNPDGGPQLKVFDDDLRLFLQRVAAKAVADFRQLPTLKTQPPDSEGATTLIP